LNTRYCNHLNEDYIDFLLRGEIAIYKAFFDWMQREVREERARFKDLETYKNYWKRLSQYYYLFKKEPLNGHVFTQLQRVCILSSIYLFFLSYTLSFEKVVQS